MYDTEQQLAIALDTINDLAAQIERLRREVAAAQPPTWQALASLSSLRDVDSEFTCSQAYWTEVKYIVLLDVTAGLLSPKDIGVDLLVAGNLADRVWIYSNILSGLGVGQQTKQIMSLSAWVPPGADVSLSTWSQGSAGTATLQGYSEVVWG